MGPARRTAGRRSRAGPSERLRAAGTGTSEAMLALSAGGIAVLAMCIVVLVIVALAAIPRARASLQERRIYARQREIAAR